MRSEPQHHGAGDERPLDLGRLDRMTPLRTIPGRNRTKADILVYRDGALQVALKDYRARPWWVRGTVGRWLVARESRAYEAAAGIEGVARFLGRLGPLSLATEWVEGTPLRELVGKRLDPEVFARLRATLDRLHDAGIALGDLHMRDVVLDAEGGVTLVDLATAVIAGPRAGRGRLRLFERLRLQDEISFVRLRARFSGEDPDRAVEELGPEVARAFLRGRALRRRLRGRKRRRA